MSLITARGELVNMLTFDDRYVDHYKKGPLLRKRNIKATFFLIPRLATEQRANPSTKADLGNAEKI